MPTTGQRPDSVRQSRNAAGSRPTATARFTALVSRNVFFITPRYCRLTPRLSRGPAGGGAVGLNRLLGDVPLIGLSYCASPICFMNVWLSQKRYSSSMTPSFQWPTVHITSLNGLPVGGIDLPSAVGIVFVKVPSITPMTLVHSPDPNLTG